MRSPIEFFGSDGEQFYPPQTPDGKYIIPLKLPGWLIFKIAKEIKALRESRKSNEG